MQQISFVVLYVFLTGVACGQAAKDPAAPQGQVDAPKGLVPIPDYTAARSESRYLTGDWDGFRTNLAGRGLTFDVSFTQVEQGVVDGGQERGWRYGGKVDAYLTFDLDRMGVLPGALVTMRTESRYGQSVNGMAGTLLPVDDVLFFPLTDPEDEDLAIAITELRYTQFLSKQIGLFAGKFTTFGADTNEFAGGRGDTQFLSHTFTSASVTALVNPYSTLGAGVVLLPNDQVVITSSIFSRADSSTTSGFDTLGDGWVWAASIRAQSRFGDLPGGAMITGQYAFDTDYVDFSGQFVTPTGVAIPQEGETWVVFANGWQYLHVEEPANKPINVPDGRADLQGTGVFARAGIADRDTNPVEWILSGGIAGKGVLPGRDHDTFGVGYGYSAIRDVPFVSSFVIDSRARRFEGYYTAAITPAAELTFDVQWADSLLTALDPAVILGVRFRLSF